MTQWNEAPTEKKLKKTQHGGMSAFLKKTSMTMDVEETEILTVSRTAEEDFKINIGNKMVKITNTFKYLGSVVTEEGGNGKDISERINKFSASVETL